MMNVCLDGMKTICHLLDTGGFSLLRRMMFTVYLLIDCISQVSHFLPAVMLPICQMCWLIDKVTPLCFHFASKLFFSA